MWMNLNDFMLSEISQAERHTVQTHLHVEFKIVKLIKAEDRMLVARDRGEGKGRCWSSTKFQLCMLSEFWRSNVQQCDCS